MLVYHCLGFQGRRVLVLRDANLPIPKPCGVADEPAWF